MWNAIRYVCIVCHGLILSRLASQKPAATLVVGRPHDAAIAIAIVIDRHRGDQPSPGLLRERGGAATLIINHGGAGGAGCLKHAPRLIKNVLSYSPPLCSN